MGDAVHAQDTVAHVYKQELSLRVTKDEERTAPKKTLIHEVLHTLGGVEQQAYQRIGMVLEETVTEEMAQMCVGGTWKSRTFGVARPQPIDVHAPYESFTSPAYRALRRTSAL